MTLCQRRWIAARRERRDEDDQARCSGERTDTKQRLSSAGVGVEREHYGRGKPPERRRLVFGHGRAHQRDGVDDPGLMHRQRIDVALDHDDLTCLRNGSARSMCAVEQLAFAEERAGRRVDVLRTAHVAELARAEPEHVASRVADRKHQATPEPVLQRPPTARSADKPDVAQLLRREPGRLRGAQQRRRVGGGEADGERVANGLANAARGEVFGGPLGFRRPRASKVLRVERGRAIQRFERSRATSTVGLGAGILVLSLQLDAGTASEELERRREVQALLELDEGSARRRRHRSRST